MNVDKEKLKVKLARCSFSDLAKYLNMHRTNLYYHYRNLKKGKLTFDENIIKKISLYLSDEENLFFYN